MKLRIFAEKILIAEGKLENSRRLADKVGVKVLEIIKFGKRARIPMQKRFTVVQGSSARDAKFKQLR